MKLSTRSKFFYVYTAHNSFIRFETKAFRSTLGNASIQVIMCNISLSGCYLMLIAVLFRWNHLLQMSEGRFLSFRVFRHSEGTQRVYLLPSFRIVNMNHSLLMLFYVSYVDGALDQCCLLSHLRFLWSCTEKNHQRWWNLLYFFLWYLPSDHRS